MRDSLQVLDMEALRTESSFARQEAQTGAYSRVALPLLLPLGILAFALLFVYGLSRVYLEIQGDWAVALAAVLAIIVMLFAALLRHQPEAAGWQIGGVLVLGAVLLAGGAIWAVAEEDEGEAAGAGRGSAGRRRRAGRRRAGRRWRTAPGRRSRRRRELDHPQ